jgi:uncharacterized protein (TIGR04255 family)
MAERMKTFPHLSRAPIVEAVIDIRAKLEKEWQQESIEDQLKKELPDYPHVEPQRMFRTTTTIHRDQQPQTATKDLGWKGFLFRSEDNLQVVQFQRDGFVYSRLEPYEDWDRLIREAHRLWDIYKKYVSPLAPSRLGVRFINRIEAASEGRIEDYLRDSPEPPCGLEWPFNGFFHRDNFTVPGTPYSVNLIRLLEASQPPITQKMSFIVDIDVFVTSSLELDNIWGRHLDEIHDIKNEVFFGSVTHSLVEAFK